MMNMDSVTSVTRGPYGRFVSLTAVTESERGFRMGLTRLLQTQTGDLYCHAIRTRTTVADVSAVWYAGNLSANTVRAYIPPTGKWEFIIVIGDFNTPDDVQTTPQIDASSLEPFTNAAWKHVEGEGGWINTRNIGGSKTLYFYGDNIFLSPGLEFTGDWGTFSLPDVFDHQPIWADIRFSKATPVRQTTSP